MRVRDATVADAAAVAALLAELGYPDERGRVARRIERFAHDPRSSLLLADEGRRVVGLAAATVLPLAHEDGCWCRLSALVVAAERRRGGAGRALAAAVEEQARVRGCRWVEVTSGERPQRDAAHRFYEALGYEQTSKRYVKRL